MTTPLYSIEITIQDNRRARIANVGGPSNNPNLEAKGYIIPPSYGILHLFSPHNAPEILQCRATILGYQNHPIEEISLPGQVMIDVTATVEIEGPPGTRILIQVWPTFAMNSRGGKRSYLKENGAGVLAGAVPLWADVWDYGGGADVTFYRDSTLAVVTGFFLGTGPLVGMSIPSGSGYFQTASVTPALSLIFRQQ